MVVGWNLAQSVDAMYARLFLCRLGTILMYDSYRPLINSELELTEMPSEWQSTYRGADKSLAQQERKQATATEDFDFHVAYL